MFYSGGVASPPTLLLYHSVSGALYAGLEECAQLQVATCCLCLVPGCPHYDFSQGSAELVLYAYEVDPGPFIKCD